MKPAAIGLLVPVVSIFLVAQAPPKSVTVPVTLDHNRIVIDVYIPLKDGATKRLRGLVDTGRSEVMISERVALMTGGISCDGQICSATPPQAIVIGGKRIPLSTVLPARVPRRPDNATDVLITGMSPELVIPSTVLASYDLVIDYANREFTLGEPGSVKFSGTPSKAIVHANGMLTVTGKVDERIYNFGIDTGSSATQVVAEQVDEWHKKQPGWSYVAGALGPANMTGEPNELQHGMLRLPMLQLGASRLGGVLVAAVSATRVEEFERVAHGPVVALVGGEAFKGARVGIDYAHGTVYVEAVTNFPVTGLDLVGLTLRPEVNGRYTVVAVVPFEGQPAVADVRAGDVLIGVDGAPVTGATMGQVWSLLGGDPGQVRKLIVERDGKRLTVDGPVRRFLATKAN